MENTKAMVAQSGENKVTQQLLLDYLKQTNSNLLDNEQKQFLAIASAFNLNPWKREVYAVAYGKGEGRKLSIIIGYEVYIKRAEEFPQYDGFETDFEGEGKNLCCVCKVYRKDRQHPVVSRTYHCEYAQENPMWRTKPRMMLEKVAIATAFRRAFPTEFGGMPYAPEELPDEMNGNRFAQQPQQQAQQPQQQNVKPLDCFRAKLKEFAKNEAVFADLREWMKAQGWTGPSAVPVDRYTMVYEKFDELAKGSVVDAEIVEGGD